MRKPKWQNCLTVKEITHIKETTKGTLKSLKRNFKFQNEIRKENPENPDPCFECKHIEKKLKEKGII